MRKLTKTAAVVAAMSVMAMGATVMASAAQEGWVQKGNDWYFYVKGDAVENQWALAGDKWYFLGEDGKMETDVFVYDKEAYDNFGELGGATEDVYYVGSDGAMVTGWAQIRTDAADSPTKTGKGWFYFSSTGVMYSDAWVMSSEDWYYIGSDGKMVTKDIVDNDYYVDNNGKMITGWFKANSDNYAALGVEEDSWVYAGTDGKITDYEEGWEKINGSWYYFGSVSQSSDGVLAVSGAAATGNPNQMVSKTFIKADGNTFYIKDNGAMATGWFKVKVDKENNQYYASSKGVISADKVEKISSKYYYFDEDGIYDSESKYAYKKADKTYALAGSEVTKDSEAKALLNDSDIVEVYKLKTSTMWK